MKRFFRVQSPARLISLGFAATILLGSALLMLPCSVRDGAELKYIDALYTSTSAVCVTGLIAVDAGDTFTSFGQVILALLIQIGGLGITSIGAGIMLAMGKKLDLKSRRLIQEASNLDSNRGAVRFIRSVLRTTLIFELAGAILSFFVFVQDYPPLRAMGISLFHSVAAFNNSGYDILGNFQNLIPYQNSVMLNLTTCGLVFFGGIGFLVIREMVQHKLKWRKYSMHAKVVLSVSGALILAGTLLLKATEDISWLGALFHSVSARTAGFSTYPLKTFSNAGLLALTALMFIGASPRLYRRRHQNQHLFGFDTGHEGGGDQSIREGLSQRHSQGRLSKGRRHYAAGNVGGCARHMGHGAAGAAGAAHGRAL